MTRAALLVVLAACSAPALPSELSRAYEREKAGDVTGALEAFGAAAARQCGQPAPSRSHLDNCALAVLGEAELLERAGRLDDAIAAYAAIPARTRGAPPPSSIGMFRAGRLTYHRGDESVAASYLWRAVTDYPDEGAAGDAVEFVVARTRGIDARRLWTRLADLYPRLDDHEVADNLLWWLADLAEHELSDAMAARALYDRIAVDHPESGLIDDARWRAAALSRAHGDYDGAVTRLRALLATREVAFGVGSYFSVWLDDAQLLLGRILRDDLHRLRDAHAAFERLPSDYPHSILVDDALDELAATALAQGDVAGACRASARLLGHDPDSKYAARARRRHEEHHCAQVIR